MNAKARRLPRARHFTSRPRTAATAMSERPGSTSWRELDLAARLEPHGERRLLFDRDAEDAPPDVLRRQHTALHRSVRYEIEAFAHAFPQHLAAPAQ